MSEAALQDRYLDLLLEMVFEEQEEKAVERLARSPDPELTEEQRGRADRALEKALREADRRAKQEASLRKAQRGKRRAKGLLFLVAVILFFSSAAFAANAEFWEMLLRMFVRVNEQTNSVRLYPDEETACRMEEEYKDMQPPDAWAGYYYFSSIPEGFALDLGSVTEYSVRYISGERAFTFAEHVYASGKANSLTGLDYTEAEKESAFECGRFMVWEGKPVLAWEEVFSWFELIGENMTRDELLSLAGLVLPRALDIRVENIQRQENDAALSAWWGGDWFPAFLPDGLRVTSFSGDWGGCSITLSDRRGVTIAFMETDAAESIHGTQLDKTVISTISLNGGEATLVDGYAGGSNQADVIWQAGEKSLRVRTSGYDREGTVRIAESVRRLTEEEKQGRVSWTSDDYPMNRVQPPALWQGACFPAFLPGGFSLTEYTFTDKDTERIAFRTADHEREITIRRHKNRPDLNCHCPADVQFIPCGDSTALMVLSDEGGMIFSQLMLAYQDQWYHISGMGISAEEIIQIAQSMKNRDQADFVTAERPGGWAGRCFPGLLPGDMVLAESDTEKDCVIWQGENGRRMTLRYFSFPQEVRFGELNVQGTVMTVNGCSACMLEETLFSVPKACLFWQDQSGFYELNFSGFSTEEALAVAWGIV